ACTRPGSGTAADPGPTTSAAGPGLTPAPVSMAMHVHASFSEGVASMDTHLDQARRTGVDVVWWTEHDFRQQAHGYRSAVGFDGMVEPENGLDWTWAATRSGAVEAAEGTFVTDPHSPDEPGKALRLTARGPSRSWGRLQYEGNAYNSTYSTSIAGTTLELDVLTESVGPDAELLVEVLSSYRPATASRPAGAYTLQYRVGAQQGRTTENGGLLGVVASRAQPGWQRLTLRLTDDVAALWPDLVAADAALYRLQLAVRARRGATATAVVDRLRFVRTGRDGQQSLALQADLIQQYAARYPELQQYQGSELSLVRHVNRFGGTAFLPDYGDAPPRKDTSLKAASAMVDQIHAHGGLASHNHPLDDAYPAPGALGAMIVDTGNLGADLLEVGFAGDVEAVTQAYDIAARNGIFITATGTTDDHSGQDWLGRTPRWVTHAWAASAQAPDLVAALAAGQGWFADPAGYRGAMQIELAGRPAMGGVLVTRDSRVPLTVSADELPADSTVDLVTGEVDFAGSGTPVPAISTVTIPSRNVGQGRVELDFQPGAGRYLRAVVRDGAGTVVGFSNPVWVLPEAPATDVPAQRRL
ncbi:MAG: hypothetical protein ACR2KN_08385, partial [Geodermatophilaceae bacterium]